MSIESLTRRSLLRTSAAATSLGVLGSIAGCQENQSDGSQNQNGSDGSSTRARIDTVPQGADTVIDIDVAALLADSKLKGKVNDLLAESGSDQTVSKALDSIQTKTGVDPRAIESVLSFSPLDGTKPWGVILWTNWQQSGLFGALKKKESSLSETTYSGKSMLVDDSSEQQVGVATLERGVFVLGFKSTAKEVIDLWQGNSQPVGGDVRKAYTTAAGGYVKFGFDVPAEIVPEQSSGTLDTSVFRKLTYGYGSLTSSKTLRITLRADTEEAAGQIAALLDTGQSLLRDRLQNAPSSNQRKRVSRLLDNTTVSQQGRDVRVETAKGGEMAIAMLGAVVGSFVLGVGSQQSTNQPQVALEIEYDREQKTLEIQHTAGDSVAATELYVRGSGIRTGRWDKLGGTASGSQSGTPMVVAGDTLTLENVAPDYEVSVVWRSSDSDVQAILMKADGPDA